MEELMMQKLSDSDPPVKVLFRKSGANHGSGSGSRLSLIFEFANPPWLF
jgi:hypothetical protein